ncbi:MAG: bifunctional enoyl-CoA hydratase/phosphate acetyltransferase [Acidobacteriia bacterium]|nr:bifunctional enoyl-CoA hydratase/phosphate acetyltransferase [Terriglobia bacterium]
MFRTLDELVDAARTGGPAQIAIAAGHDPDVIEAMKKAEEIGLAQGIFVGDPRKIRSLAEAAGLQIPDAQLVSEPDDAMATRKAIALIREGRAGLLMKGKVKTAALVRAVLDKEAGLRGNRLLSQVIVFQVPGFDRLMLMTDAGINIAPSFEQKAEMCRNAIEVANAIGIEKPNIALLCALEFVNPEMPATVDAAALTLMNRRGQLTGAYVEGPIALDVPLSKFAADRKGIESPLVEKTDIFVAPDIEAANILYRAILYFAKGKSGGIVLGAKVPLILLSRAEPPETKIHSIAIGMLAARAQAGMKARVAG